MIRATFRAAHHDAYREPGAPWDQPSLDALLAEAAIRAADRVLIVDASQRLTGDDVTTMVAALARAFLAAGVQPGDGVAWQRANDALGVLLPRACWRVGAIAVPIHHNFSDRERERTVARVGARLVVTDEWIAQALRSHTHGDTDSAARTLNPWTDGNALAAVLFTSGSSGTPKGVLHTQHTLAYKARLMANVHGLTPNDVVLMPAPLAHVSGVLNSITVTGVVPFRTVLMQRWDPGLALDIIEREGVSFMVGPPTFFVSLMQHASFNAQRVRSLRLISSGGAGVSLAFVEQASRTFGAVVKRTYGSTEAPTVATSTGADADNETRAASARAHDGRAIGAVELACADNGELLIRGPEVCVGYLDPHDTEAAFTHDGWYHSGDLAHISDEGWLSITGRLSEVIIRGGENIAAAEVEQVLSLHPGIDAVVVVGYPDSLMSERVCACIVASSSTDPAELTERALREWSTEQGLAKYKCAERVLLLDTLPLLATGKADRVRLRTIAATAHDVELS